MIFTATAIPGAFVIDVERMEDSRGFFARAACVDEFAARGLEFDLVQANVSGNIRRGTVRGLHYQAPPHAEKKIVRCTAGAIFDVLVDVRRNTAGFGRAISLELSAHNQRSVFIPEGVAHGFQTLADNSEVFYMMSARYNPAAARGVRWDDLALGIEWPLRDIAFLSERDRALPDFATAVSSL